MIGSTAGSYRIIDVLSVGGMGTVYRAEHTLIGRLAAVKVLNPAMSASTDIIERFFNEARATTLIKHPGIVEVYDFGYLESGNAYLVMEFLEGRTLDKRNKARGPIAEGEAAALLRAICGPLAAAHAKGIVHRDLKPDNIFLVPDAESALGERPKLLDFGIAKLTDLGLAGSATKTGSLMGTPTYMSPEQCRGTGDVDHRADIYSLGCIFYEMVTGRPPFIERGAGELIATHLFVEPDPPSRFASISPSADRLILAMLAKQAAQRPQSAYDLAQLLSEVATRGGFATSTSWERPSMPLIPMHDGRDGRGSSPSVGGLAASSTPSHLLPTMMPSTGHTPMPHPAPPTPMPGIGYTPHPTPTGPLANGTRVSTGSDHQTPVPAMKAAPGRSRRLGIVAIGALLAVAGVIAVVVGMQKGRDDTAQAQTGAGAPAATTPAQAASQTPTTTATTTPTTTATTTATTTPTTPTTPTTTATTTPTNPTNPTTTKSTKSTPTNPTTPTTARAKHPKQGSSGTAGKASRPKKQQPSQSTDPLLETDL